MQGNASEGYGTPAHGGTLVRSEDKLGTGGRPLAGRHTGQSIAALVEAGAGWGPVGSSKRHRGTNQHIGRASIRVNTAVQPGLWGERARGAGGKRRTAGGAEETGGSSERRCGRARVKSQGVQPASNSSTCNPGGQPKWMRKESQQMAGSAERGTHRGRGTRREAGSEHHSTSAARRSQRSAVDGSKGAAGGPQWHLQHAPHGALARLAHHTLKAVGCRQDGRAGRAVNIRLDRRRRAGHGQRSK